MAKRIPLRIAVSLTAPEVKKLRAFSMPMTPTVIAGGLCTSWLRTFLAKRKMNGRPKERV
ncbi:MAG: hypothetical protein LAN64_14210 [Acidobacteriia bacterium]|nr:hypothetical protein [Terriglobia bacterium]